MFGIGGRRLLSCLKGSITEGMFSCSRAHFAPVSGDLVWADPVQGVGGADDPAASGRVEDEQGAQKGARHAVTLLRRSGAVFGHCIAELG